MRYFLSYRGRLGGIVQNVGTNFWTPCIFCDALVRGVNLAFRYQHLTYHTLFKSTLYNNLGHCCHVLWRHLKWRRRGIITAVFEKKIFEKCPKMLFKTSSDICFWQQPLLRSFINYSKSNHFHLLLWHWAWHEYSPIAYSYLILVLLNYLVLESQIERNPI